MTDDPAAPPAGRAAPAEPAALLGPADVRKLAEALGVRPTKTLGQNFVHDAGTVRRIVRSAAVGQEDVVLEVGPGLGSLTLALLETGARVVAVEIDPRLAEALPVTVAARMPEAVDRLAVLRADAMMVGGPEALPAPGGTPAPDGTPAPGGMPAPDGTAAPGGTTAPGRTSAPGGSPAAGGNPAPAPTKLVANLPYNVAVPVLLTLLENLPSLREVLVMVQAEVADRIAAPPGSRTYGVPSAKAAWYADAARAGTISRTVFWPVPNVDSALVRLTRRNPPETTATREEVFAVVDAAFAQRRKTLRAALAGWAGSATAAEEALRAAGIDPGLRGERLGIADFARIAQHGRPAGAPGARSGTLGA